MTSTLLSVLTALVLQAPDAPPAGTAAPAEDPAPAATAEATAASPDDGGFLRLAPASRFGGDGIGLGLAVRADVLAMNGRPFGVTAGDGTAGGWKGISGGVSGQVAWHVPIPDTMFDRMFGVELDAGYAVSGTAGEVRFRQHESVGGGFEEVETTYAYGGVLHQIPISLGARARLPMVFPFPLALDASTGFAFVYGISDVTATVQGAAEPFTVSNVAHDASYGFYVEGGAAYALGPGEITGAYRYSSTFLKFGHDEWNALPGDLGGHHFLLGYRFVL